MKKILIGSVIALVAIAALLGVAALVIHYIAPPSEKHAEAPPCIRIDRAGPNGQIIEGDIWVCASKVYVREFITPKQVTRYELIIRTPVEMHLDPSFTPPREPGRIVLRLKRTVPPTRIEEPLTYDINVRADQLFDGNENATGVMPTAIRIIPEPIG